MNAHIPIAAAEWFRCRSEYGPNGARHVILTLDPAPRDRRYLVADDRQYQLLKTGMSPDDLDLYEIEDEDDEV